MEQQHKQRLIGAVVVVALAVIFLPMLLQGPVDRGTTDMAMDIPPRPEVEQGPADADEPVADGDEAPAPDEPQEPGEAASQLEAVPLPQSEHADAADDDEPGDAPPPEPEAVPEEEVADEDPPEAPAEDTADASDENDELASWAVQVGSFTSESNALGLRDRLREMDFSAYVDRLERDGEDTIYRLRVGPVVERDEAEALLEELQADADMDGLVVSHP
ncbi:SPOR domain-containing protein [Aquisalimonas asiatica]|uniref:DedD protein n=1 Tax=Aquisalimonas asiatica TaxID=406100 RepID=A0A1H8RNQ4_9GAMM|nr:SPOR domain-containing protein [Aquisalimonas asiatica]SEO67917.1 DedD protein [Aquisalimonas asiatica]